MYAPKGIEMKGAAEQWAKCASDQSVPAFDMRQGLYCRAKQKGNEFFRLTTSPSM